MGIDDSIMELTTEGFEIKNDGNNYMVAFPNDKCAVWERFISSHLELSYWNEYLLDDFSDDELLYMIDLAYEAVLHSFIKKIQAEIMCD